MTVMDAISEAKAFAKPTDRWTPLLTVDRLATVYGNGTLSNAQLLCAVVSLHRALTVLRYFFR